MDKIGHLSLRIENSLLKKFKYVCKYEDRSANGQILSLIRNFVKDFEEKHHKIEINEDENDNGGIL